MILDERESCQDSEWKTDNTKRLRREVLTIHRIREKHYKETEKWKKYQREREREIWADSYWKKDNIKRGQSWPYRE